MVGAKSATEPLGRIMKKPSLAGTSLLAYAFALRSVACTSPSPSPPLGGDAQGGCDRCLDATATLEAQGGVRPDGSGQPDRAADASATPAIAVVDEESP